MSIYPVRLSEWFPVKNKMHSSAFSIVRYLRCYSCGTRVRWKAAIGHHSLPWGCGDLWCSWKCCHSGKESKPDFRRERRLKRRYKECNILDIYKDIEA